MPQPHLLDSGSDRLPVPGHPRLWVEFRREISYPEDLAIEQQRQEIASRAPRAEGTGERVLAAHLVAEFVIVKAVAMITAWNLTGHDKEVLPITSSSFALLQKEVIRFIGDEATRRLLGRPEEKEAPFGTRSRRSSRRARA